MCRECDDDEIKAILQRKVTPDMMSNNGLDYESDLTVLVQILKQLPHTKENALGPRTAKSGDLHFLREIKTKKNNLRNGFSLLHNKISLIQHTNPITTDQKEIAIGEGFTRLGKTKFYYWDKALLQEEGDTQYEKYPTSQEELIVSNMNEEDSREQRNIELQRIREEMLLRAQVKDEIREERERKEREKEEQRQREISEKKEITKLLSLWFDRLPIVYRGNTTYLYLIELYVHSDYVPGNRLEYELNYQTGKYVLNYLDNPHEYVSYFGQSLKIEDNRLYRKYACARLPELYDLYEAIKQGAREHFQNTFGATIEEFARNRSNEYLDIYLNTSKGGCTDPAVISMLEKLRERIESLLQDDYA